MMLVTLKISVHTNEPISEREIARLVGRLIDSGLADAADTLATGEGDLAAAERATNLNISAPVVCSRC